MFEYFGKAGLRLKEEKCVFIIPQVEYMGHKITAAGVFLLEEKVEAIHKVPAPKDAKELQGYLEFLNYYHRFVPNVASILAPLHELLRKGMI